MVGENKKEDSHTPTDVDSHSQIHSDDGSKKNENSDPKSSSKSGSSKKGSSKGKPCCCCRCCGDQDSDDDERRDSNEDSKETIPKTVASPDPDQIESDKKIMTLEPVPSTSPPGSPADSAEEISHPAIQTPVEFDNFDPEPLVVKAADKDIEVLDALLIEADQDRKILEAEPPEKQTIPDPAVKEESDSDDGKNASFHADKLSVEGNDKKDRELLEKRKNSREGVSVEDRPAEYLQLSMGKSKSESSSQTMSDEMKPELKSSGSDPKRPACVGYKWKMFSWFNKKKP